ncbi:MAG: hypothetical protein MHPSP_000298, partial [Paramarteilia canceri]
LSSIEACDKANKKSFSFDFDTMIKKLKYGLFYRFKKSNNSSEMWLLYFHLHIFELTNNLDILTSDDFDGAYDILKNCQSVIGGFSELPLGYSGIVSSYPAVCCVGILGTEKFYDLVDRKSMLNFLKKSKHEKGYFVSSMDEDTDLRPTFCALAIAKMLMLPDWDILIKDVKQYVLECQNYEGGFGAMPGGEAHSGYTYCACAILSMLNALDECNIDSLINWIKQRQSLSEGGFNGRTCKVADSCYTFYIGSTIRILSQHTNQDISNFFDEMKLYTFLKCCYDEDDLYFAKNPMFISDIYHNCYTLAGASILGIDKFKEFINFNNDEVFNITKEKLDKMQEYFRNKNV